MSEFKKLPLSKLYISKKNVRKNYVASKDETLMALVNDIRRNGLINPISVRKSSKNNKYEVFAGQRRFISAIILKWKEIPCMIYSNISDTEIKLKSLSENIQRKKMSIKDKCNAFYEFYKIKNKSYKLVSQVTSYSISTIRKYIRIKEKLNYKLLELIDSSSKGLTLEFAYDICTNVTNMNDQLIIYNKLLTVNDTKIRKQILRKYSNNNKIDIDSLIIDGHKKKYKKAKKEYDYLMIKGKAIKLPKNCKSIFHDIIKDNRTDIIDQIKIMLEISK